MLISKFDNNNICIGIKDLEEMYKITFPEQYKQFLLKYNGGKTPETEFRINGVSSDIQGFYGLGNISEYYNFNSIMKHEKMEEWLVNKMFPIAFNVFGDYILISVGEENTGKVYFYYHDRPTKYIELAEDFKCFIKKCKSKKIGHIRSIEERKNDMIRLGKGDKITPEKISGWQAEIDEYSNTYQEDVTID